MFELNFLVLFFSTFYNSQNNFPFLRASSNDSGPQVRASNRLVSVLCDVFWRTRRKSIGNLCT